MVTWQSPWPFHLHLSLFFSLSLLPASPHSPSTIILTLQHKYTTPPQKKRVRQKKRYITNFPPFFLPLLALWDKFTPKLPSLIIWVASLEGKDWYLCACFHSQDRRGQRSYWVLKNFVILGLVLRVVGDFTVIVLAGRRAN